MESYIISPQLKTTLEAKNAHFLRRIPKILKMEYVNNVEISLESETISSKGTEIRHRTILEA